MSGLRSRLSASGWEDLAELPPAFARDARFLWDRFLPLHGAYRWRVYEAELDRARGDDAGAAGRLERILRGTPFRAPARADEDARAWAAESATASDPARAARELGRSLARADRAEVRAWLVAALARAGNERGARDEASRCLDAAPGLSAARVLRALLAVRAGDEAAALADLDEAVARRPAPGLYALRAERLWLAGRRGEAVDDAHAAVDAHPENMDGFVRLLYARRGSKAAFERSGEGAIVRDEARRAERDPADASWAFAVGGALAGHGAEQIRLLRAALDAGAERAWIRAFLGRALADERAPGDRARNLAAASEEMDRAVARDPRSGWIRFWRAEVRKRQGRDEEALVDADDGSRLDPDYKLGAAWRAELRAARGDFAGAIEDATDAWRALKRPTFLYRRSELRVAAGDAAGAQEDLAECARVSSSHSFALSPFAWINASRRTPYSPSPTRGADFRGARALLRRLPKKDPWRGLADAPCEDARSIWWTAAGAAPAGAAGDAFRGRALLDRGDERGALAALDAAARRRPGLHAARLWRGEAAARLGRWREASREFAAAVETGPRSAPALLWSGLAQWRLRRPGEAARLWTEAAALESVNARLASLWLRSVGVPPRARRGVPAPARAAAAELELRLGASLRAAALAARATGARARLVEGAAMAAVGRDGRAHDLWVAAVLEDAELSAKLLPDLLAALPPLAPAGSVAAHLALARAWGALGRDGEREAALSVARALSASLEAGAGASPWALAALGAAERAAGRLEPARALFDRAVAADPDLASARLWRAEVRLTTGDAAGALADLSAVGARVAADAEALTWRGRALCATGLCARASKDFAAASRIDARSPWPLLADGDCLRRRGRPRAAVARFERARRLAPGLFARAEAGA